MALRAFQINPSIGGFGGESTFVGRFNDDSQRSPFPSSGRDENGDMGDTNLALSLTQASHRNGKDSSSSGKTVLPSSSQTIAVAGRHEKNRGNLVTGSCDAFAQIVKELVDNAVDACVSIDGGESTRDDGNSKKKKKAAGEVPAETSNKASDEEVCKRVRVNIVPETFNDMEVLRITVIDTGCGMENIDDCVTVFSSSKNGTQGGKILQNGKNAAEKGKKKGGQNRKKSKNNASPPNENDRHTAGRYGVGLTLCLLHAQRLVPGSEGIIQSAIASCDEWEKATYMVDTEKDEIVCKKRTNIRKVRAGECGTSISVLVPGGDGAHMAWPRLAEYFARFQLNTNLPCSLEVKAPTLSRIPLHILPPAELEKRHRKKMMRLPAIDLLSQAEENKRERHDSDSGCNHSDEGHAVDWGDCCDDDDDDDLSSEDENDEDSQKPTKSKAVQDKERAEENLAKKKELIRKGAKEYVGKEVNIKNVAFITQPIRRENGSGHTSSSKNSTSFGPFLEMAIVVFGPDSLEDNGCGDENSNDESYLTAQNRFNHDHLVSTAKLSVVRMVNGIPLLDGPEALACGVVQKISNNTATWSSFGLDLALRKRGDSGVHALGERRRQIDKDTPTFLINDSAQVAPYFRDNAHASFHDQSHDYSESSSDDDFDPETMHRKRKKKRSSRSILPAPLRLGHVLMIVQIRAKPSALPLPTLSKGRLPMNDKGIDDALENSITECLKSLQKSNPDLLLTANQLKRLERDAKYVPAVASAIASILCHPMRRNLHSRTLNAVSGWDKEESGTAEPPSENVDRSSQRNDDIQGTRLGRVGPFCNTPVSSQEEEEAMKVEMLRPILERRLRFVVSDELKEAKDKEEKDRRKKAREESIAKRARSLSSKKKVSIESDSMVSDCLESDDSIEGQTITGNNKNRFLEREESPGMLLNDGFESDRRSKDACDSSENFLTHSSMVETEDVNSSDDEWF